MSLAIAAGTLTAAASPVAMSPTPPNQQAAPNTSASPLTLQPTPSLADNPAVAQANKAMALQGKLASDLQSVVDALTASMRKVVEDRPDLALSSFDFQSNHGAIKVISVSLSDHDKAWLEQTLNANSSLVDAVKAFHDDAANSYALFAGATGQPVSASDADQLSTLTDRSFNFMGMLQNASRAMLQAMDSHGRYVTANGATIDFHRPVNSALDFLVFQKSERAIRDGTSTYSSVSGRMSYGTIKGNVFSIGAVIPSFLPDAGARGLALNATA